MTVYIAGPDRRAQRGAEPPLLQCLRRHHSALLALFLEVESGHLRLRRRDLENRLRGPLGRIQGDIKTAEREVAAKESK